MTSISPNYVNPGTKWKYKILQKYDQQLMAENKFKSTLHSLYYGKITKMDIFNQVFFQNGHHFSASILYGHPHYQPITELNFKDTG
jgi:hypothetical protein